MATQWLRRAWLLAAGASVLLLAACGGGGGEVESSLTPARIVVFGDAMADLGQNATGQRYTVNDGSVNNWTVVVGNAFGRALTPAKSGGTSYATANARVALKPGAAGDAAAPTLVEQIDSFLATNTLTVNDLVVVNVGTSDVIVQGRAAIEGAQTRDQMLAALAAAGTALGGQVHRLVNAGARHVVVVGPYNLGRSPWAKEVGQAGLLEAGSSAFNDKFKLSAVDLGDTVLYVDAAQQFNLYEGNPANYGLENTSAPACTSRDPGEGIGTGLNQVDSSECTSATVVGTVHYDAYLFADRVYPTPRGHRLFGEYAMSRIRERW
jgi:outer membrane lipase/esterase